MVNKESQVSLRTLPQNSSMSTYDLRSGPNMTYGRPRGATAVVPAPPPSSVMIMMREGARERGERGNGGREPVEEEAVAPTDGRTQQVDRRRSLVLPGVPPPKKRL